MKYHSETIAHVVGKLNTEYFLPAIQREFVWKADQIIQLFDSIMRGYPISSFLFWELEALNKDKWQAYKFLDSVHSDGSTNEVANTNGVSGLHLILDGQQRLTSLNVGLRGHYLVRRKGARRDNPNAVTRQKLYLNLRHDAEQQDAEIGEGTYYELAFLEPTQAHEPGKLWFEVSGILRVESEPAADQLRDGIIEGMGDDTTRAEERVIRRNFDRLFRAIHRDNVIMYYVEREHDYDRVLDIFVRANSGGTKLSKSDLLMSTVTGSWGDIDAREEIHSFVNRLNLNMTRRNNLDKDFVMKACLVLSDLPVQYKVQNFNHANLMKIRGLWGLIKGAMEQGIDLVNRAGVDESTLTSANALIPILYYLLQRPDMQPSGSTPFEIRNAGIMRRWLISALLTGAFGGSSDTALASVRHILRTTPGDADFPADAINQALRQSGRSARVDDVLDAVLGLRYGKRSTFLALSLLYDDRPWGTISYHVDHIMPRSTISRYSVLLAQDRETYLWNRDRIGNLMLLIDRENEEKNDKPFQEWIVTRDDSFLARQLIPSDRGLWVPERLADFVQAREALICERVRAAISFGTDRES